MFTRAELARYGFEARYQVGWYDKSGAVEHQGTITTAIT